MAMMESAHFGKMTKGKAAKKLSLKRKEKLEGRKIRGWLSRDALERKVSKKLFGEKVPRAENYEKQGMGQPPKLLAQH